MLTYGLLILGTSYVHKRGEQKLEMPKTGDQSDNVRIALGVILTLSGIILSEYYADKLGATSYLLVILVLFFALVAYMTADSAANAENQSSKAFGIDEFPRFTWFIVWVLSVVVTSFVGVKFNHLNTGNSVSVMGNTGYQWGFWGGSVVGLVFALITLLWQHCGWGGGEANSNVVLDTLQVGRGGVNNAPPVDRASLVRNNLKLDLNV